MAKFFGALLEQDAISWQVLESIRLTQDDTTSSSRIFIKILFQVRLRTHWAHPSALIFSGYMGPRRLSAQSAYAFLHWPLHAKVVAHKLIATSLHLCTCKSSEQIQC